MLEALIKTVFAFEGEMAVGDSELLDTVDYMLSYFKSIITDSTGLTWAQVKERIG